MGLLIILMAESSYTEDDIKSLSWREHIRLRPGMYIGKLGDGSEADDGIYVLLKEVLDNCVDEFVMGHGKRIEITIEADGMVEVRDFGRGIPLGKLMDCAAKINTGAKYDSEAFKRSVGLNGVGIKAVNALSDFFEIQAFREGETRAITFSRGEVTEEMKRSRKSSEENGTRLMFHPDPESFASDFAFQIEIVEQMLRYYSYLNPGLALVLNGKTFRSKDGLLDLLQEKMSEEPIYPIVHLVGSDVEIAFTHVESYGEDHFSFVNGQHTTMGGSHQAAFREAIVKCLRDHFKKQYDPQDIRQGIVAAVSVKVQEPVFESQTKTKLGSTHMEPGGRTVRGHIGSVLAEELDNHLIRNREAAEALQQKIIRSEKERKEMAGLQKAAKERAKKSKLVNKKLRDCRVHFDGKDKRREESMLFVTEGDSASGSITKSRCAETQAVFSLRGKPLNCFGLTKKVVYENEELALLQNALGIEHDIDDLRYNKVVLATDADVDGMHIRLLLMTFFLQFFPDLVRQGHVFILQTPLFRVRNKKETRYCYSEEERRQAIAELGKNPEITRFKGLGEISPDEFKGFIGQDIRLDPVTVDEKQSLREMLAYFMGKNTPERQKFIIQNLRVEADIVEGEEAGAEAAAA